MRRALAAPTRAYALLAEPVDPAIEAERLRFRRAYADELRRACCATAIDRGELRPDRRRPRRRRPRRRARGGAVGPLDAPGARRGRPRRRPSSPSACPPFAPERSPSAVRHPRPSRSTPPTRSPTRCRPFEDVNLFELDLALQEALEREGGGWAVDRARESGAIAGSAEAIEHAPPRRAQRAAAADARPHRAPRRRRRVRPVAGTGCCKGAVEREIHSLPWRDPRPGRARRARGAVHALVARPTRASCAPSR